MSAYEAAPYVEEDEREEQRSLQHYLGESAVVAADSEVETYARVWKIGKQNDRYVTRRDFRVRFLEATPEGDKQRDLLIATSPDEFTLHSFTAKTGLDWAGAQEWEVWGPAPTAE